MDTQLLLTIIGVTITTIGVIIAAIKAREDIKHIAGRIKYKTGLKIDSVRKIPGKRQTRAELIDVTRDIQSLFYQIEEALRAHHTLITKINNETGKTIKQEHLNEKGKIIEDIKERQTKLYSKMARIKHRTWKGTETHYPDEKPQKRI